MFGRKKDPSAEIDPTIAVSKKGAETGVGGKAYRSVKKDLRAEGYSRKDAKRLAGTDRPEDQIGDESMFAKKGGLVVSKNKRRSAAGRVGKSVRDSEKY